MLLSELAIPSIVIVIVVSPPFPLATADDKYLQHISEHAILTCYSQDKAMFSRRWSKC